MALDELVLVRHGESVGNVAAAAAGRSGAEVVDVPARDADVALTPLGQEQARAAGAALAAWPAPTRPQVLVCSPYRRARDTARLMCHEAGVDLAERVDERLRDRELGVLDRLTQRGVRARFPQEAERRRWQGKYYHRPAGGESWADVALRVRTWLSDLEVHATEVRRVLVVTHDVVALTVRAVCLGMEEQQVLDLARHEPLRNASISRLVRTEDAGWSVAAYDDVAHLEHLDVTPTEHPGDRRA